MQLPVHIVLDELVKLGAVSDDDAERSLVRLDQLERNRLTRGKAARYGVMGAATGAGLHAIGKAIEGGPKPGFRGLAAAGVKGAIGGGAIPLVQNHLDQQSEMSTLKRYIAEQTQPPLEIQKVAGKKAFLLWKLAMMLPPPSAAAKAIGAGLSSQAGSKAVAGMQQALHLPKGVGIPHAREALPVRTARAHNFFIEEAKKPGSEGFYGHARGTVPSQLPPTMPTMPPKPGQSITPSFGGSLAPPKPAPAAGASAPPTVPPPKGRLVLPASPGLGTAPTLPAPASLPQFSHAPTMRP